MGYYSAVEEKKYHEFFRLKHGNRKEQIESINPHPDKQTLHNFSSEVSSSKYSHFLHKFQKSEKIKTGHCWSRVVGSNREEIARYKGSDRGTGNTEICLQREKVINTEERG